MSLLMSRGSRGSGVKQPGQRSKYNFAREGFRSKCVICTTHGHPWSNRNAATSRITSAGTSSPVFQRITLHTVSASEGPWALPKVPPPIIRFRTFGAILQVNCGQKKKEMCDSSHQNFLVV